MIAKESGMYAPIKQKGATLLKKLENAPLKRDPNEVIPYEQLWEWALLSIKSGARLINDMEVERQYKRHVI